MIDYIKHLKNIEFTKQLRATVSKNEANTRKTKKYKDYNWSAMIKDGSIGKLTVIELNKFLQANKLPQQVNKLDKIKTIVNHLQVTELSIPLGGDTDEDEEVILAATVTDNEEAEAEANSRSKSGRLRRPTHTFNSDFVFYCKCTVIPFNPTEGPYAPRGMGREMGYEIQPKEMLHHFSQKIWHQVPISV